jgi:hypothetical protein
MNKRSSHNANQPKGITGPDTKNSKIKAIEKLDAENQPHNKYKTERDH